MLKNKDQNNQHFSKSDEQDFIINLQSISKSFIENGKTVKILHNLDLKIKKGEKVAIVGPSGSGKSTLLSIISGLDKVDEGDIYVNGKDLNSLNENELAKYRNLDIGMIFQSFELILPFNVIENISAPQEISNKIDHKHVEYLLEQVSLLDKKSRSVINLSGGEKQRVAIARSLANNPDIILADEPTGSLDRVSSKKVLSTLLELVDKDKKTLIIITHDEEIAKYMDKIYEIKDANLLLVR